MSTPLDLPSAPGFRKISWQPLSAVAATTSPFTYHAKVYEHEGQVRDVICELPAMRPDVAAPWRAFFLRLNGRAGRFYLRDTVGRRLRGQGTGAPAFAALDGPGAIDVTGFAANVVHILRQGDWISLADRLHEVLEDVTTDAAGACTVSVWPAVRVAPAVSTPLLLGPAARGIFELLEMPEWGWDERRHFAPLSFSAREVVP